MKDFVIRSKDNGLVISEHDTYTEASYEVIKSIIEDMENKEYEIGFYEIWEKRKLEL
jgi:hypothetical protein